MCLTAWSLYCLFSTCVILQYLCAVLIQLLGYPGYLASFLPVLYPCHVTLFVHFVRGIAWCTLTSCSPHYLCHLTAPVCCIETVAWCTLTAWSFYCLCSVSFNVGCFVLTQLARFTQTAWPRPCTLPMSLGSLSLAGALTNSSNSTLSI